MCIRDSRYIFDITHAISSIIVWNNVDDDYFIKASRRSDWHISLIKKHLVHTEIRGIERRAQHVLVLTTLVLLDNRLDKWFYKDESENLLVSSVFLSFFSNARDMTHTRLSVKKKKIIIIIDNSEWSTCSRKCRARQVVASLSLTR